MNQLLMNDIIVTMGERKAQARLGLAATTDIMPGESPGHIAHILIHHLLQRIYGDCIDVLEEADRLLKEGDVGEARHLLKRLRRDLLRGVWVKEPQKGQLSLFSDGEC